MESVRFDVDEAVCTITLDRPVVPWLERTDDRSQVTVLDLPLREHIEVPVREPG